MTLVAILAALLIGLVVNEMSEVSPWLARRLAGWSARVRYAGTERTDIRAEELAALVNQRPGKLLKLGTASGFALSSIAHRLRRRLTGREDPAPLLSLDEMNRLLPLTDEPEQTYRTLSVPNRAVPR